MDIRESVAAKPAILVVCTGNICRSPMGEVVLREFLGEHGETPLRTPRGDNAPGGARTLADVSVISSGVSSEEDGNPIYPPAARILRSHGYPVPVRRAHRTTASELREAGLILAMTTGHARSLRPMCEAAGVPLELIHLWREFDGSGLVPATEGCFGPGGALERSGSTDRRYSNFYTSDGEWDVPDPWYTGDFDSTLAVVEAGARGIVDYLSA